MGVQVQRETFFLPTVQCRRTTSPDQMERRTEPTHDQAKGIIMSWNRILTLLAGVACIQTSVLAGDGQQAPNPNNSSTSPESQAPNRWTDKREVGCLAVVASPALRCPSRSRALARPGEVSIQHRDGTAGSFIVVGDEQTMLISKDGVSWNHVRPLINSDPEVIASGGGVNVRVGPHGVVQTSCDLKTWTTCCTAIPERLHGVTYGNGLFVAVGNEGAV